VRACVTSEKKKQTVYNDFIDRFSTCTHRHIHTQQLNLEHPARRVLNIMVMRNALLADRETVF